MIAGVAVDLNITDEELRRLSLTFDAKAPRELLLWALDQFDRDVALATGFGAEGCVLVHMLAQIDNNARIFYLDTDLLFSETYTLRDRLEERYGVRFERKST